MVDARTDEYALSLGGTHTWDFARVAVFAGLGVGAALTHQTFDTPSDAPSRVAFSPLGYLTCGAFHTLGRRGYIGLDLRFEGRLMRFRKTAVTEPGLRAAAALGGSSVVGIQF
jgi:hypothetical protein